VTSGEPDKEERDAPPIRHHYVLVLVVQALTLTTLWFVARLFR
jgi:hypothetical protein